jgi:hypothetical protein
LNINITYEKEVFAVSPGADPLLELIGGGSIHAGTMENKLSAYSLLRLGIMRPYFDGLLSQYASGSSPDKKEHIQLYFFARPECEVVYTNAILEGGMFTHPPHGKEDGATDAGQTGGQTAALAAQSGAATSSNQGGGASGTKPTAPAAAAAVNGLTSYHALRNYTYSMDYGAVLALRTWSLSFTQSWTSAMMRGLYNHEVGNLSLYIGL